MVLKMIPRRKINIYQKEFTQLFSSIFDKKSNSFKCIDFFEKEFAKYIGVKHAIAVGSGRFGMKLILSNLNITDGDEIIIPAYTLKYLVNILQSIGLKPIVADIDLDTFNIDPDDIEKKISSKTKVIAATHIFGVPCKINEILDIVKKHNIFVLEDCAHSLGSVMNNKQTGFFGDASFFSFDVIKPVNTYGGGMVVTNNDSLAQKIRASNQYGDMYASFIAKRLFASFLENLILPTPIAYLPLALLASEKWSKKMHDLYRGSQKLSAPEKFFTGVQSQIGSHKLSTLEERTNLRRQKALYVKNQLKEKIVFQKIEENHKVNYYFLTGRVETDIGKLRKKLLGKGIDSGIYSELTDNCAKVLNDKSCPNVDLVYDSNIQIPLYETINEKQLDKMVKVFEELL